MVSAAIKATSNVSSWCIHSNSKAQQKNKNTIIWTPVLLVCPGWSALHKFVHLPVVSSAASCLRFLQMPGLLAATPERLVRTACLGINNRMLGFVVRKFVDTVAGDYRQWARNLKDKAAQ